jgi:hypothetical protein
MSILDRLAGERLRNHFRPATARELFILRLAQKLGEPFATEHYIALATEHSDETLLLAFRRTFSQTHPPRDLGRQFHAELAAAREQHNHSKTGRLLAIKVERRSVAVAVFVDSTLDFHDVRQLSSQADKAETTAIGFLNWVIGSFDIQSVALERMTNSSQIRRALLNEAILGILRNAAIPVWEVDKRNLLEAYGHPPLRSRVELRQAVKAILWSMFNSDKPNNQEIDAAALGLHVQTERLFLY